MPRQYAPEAKREALSLYIALGELEAVAAEMRKRGYADYSVETLRRWRNEGGWEKLREESVDREARAALVLDAEATTADMLRDYQVMRKELSDRRARGELDYSEAVTLQLKVDGLIRQLLAQRESSRAGRVDRPALWLEFFEQFLGDLAEIDPGALAALEPHLEEIRDRAKARLAEAA